jgi:hypothetical protein
MTERECFGTDEYVSACNRLPFAGSNNKGSAGCALLCLVFVVIPCAIACGICLLAIQQITLRNALYR